MNKWFNNINSVKYFVIKQIYQSQFCWLSNKSKQVFKKKNEKKGGGSLQ